MFPFRKWDKGPLIEYGYKLNVLAFGERNVEL